jgi:hypothetical protein
MRTRRRQVEAPKKHGGGRPSQYDEPLRSVIAVRLDGPQADAVEVWCTANSVSPVMLLREAVLERIGRKDLGLGLEPGSADRVVRLGSPANLPVGFTRAQHAAILDASSAMQVAPSLLMRDAALSRIGRKDLGSLARLEAFRRTMG